MSLKSLYLCRMFELESSLSVDIDRDFNIQILQQGRGEGRVLTSIETLTSKSCNKEEGKEDSTVVTVAGEI